MPLYSTCLGQSPDHQEAMLFTLENARLRARVTNYGGRIISIEMPDREGHWAHMVLGFDTLESYLQDKDAFGALLGRNANRIAGARFTLDGREYQLEANDRTATLHGGKRGFDKLFWQIEAAQAEPVPSLVLTHISPDGDQRFPGALSVRATYRLQEDSLWLEMTAETTKPTIVSLSAHPYFNLAGVEGGDVLGHELAIASDSYLPTDGQQIPTGEIRPVEKTPFDFRQPHAIGSRIREADPQLIYGQGYDHSYVLGSGQAESPFRAARVRDPSSGRLLEIHTNQPAMQLYTGNKLDGRIAGREGMIYRQSAGFALEPQGFPDAPHHANFPSTVLRPGARYHAMIRYRFTLD